MMVILRAVPPMLSLLLLGILIATMANCCSAGMPEALLNSTVALRAGGGGESNQNNNKNSKFPSSFRRHRGPHPDSNIGNNQNKFGGAKGGGARWGRKKETVDEEGSALEGTIGVHLRRMKQPCCGWGIVGEIFAGDNFKGKPYNVIFDPQSSSTFLFHPDIKRMTKNGQNQEEKSRGKKALSWLFSKTAGHLYDPEASSTSEAVVPSDWFEIKYPDGSRYQGGMATDSLRIGEAVLREGFGTVKRMNDVAEELRGIGSYDGIVGLGFQGFAKGDDATAVMPDILNPVLIKMELAKHSFSLYVSKTGKTGEIRFGGYNPSLILDTPVGQEPPSVTYFSLDIDNSIMYKELDEVDLFQGSSDSVSSKEDDEEEGGQFELDNINDAIKDGGRRKRRPARLLSERDEPYHMIDLDYDWMWALMVGSFTIGRKKIASKFIVTFTTLVHYGIVVNVRDDYMTSHFHNALLGGMDNGKADSVVDIPMGEGQGAGGVGQLLIPCDERESLPHLTFTIGKKTFASFTGKEYFSTKLKSSELKRLVEGRKVKKIKGKWCSTREFIQFKLAPEHSDEHWQLGLGFMQKYYLEFDSRDPRRQGIVPQIGIALSKGVEVHQRHKKKQTPSTDDDDNKKEGSEDDESSS